MLFFYFYFFILIIIIIYFFIKRIAEQINVYSIGIISILGWSFNV